MLPASSPAPRLVHTGPSDDGDVLAFALAPGPGCRFVSISAHGAGEPALTLAAAGADQIFAFDLAEPEALGHLLGLKLEAARLLGREDVLAVLGLRPASRLRRGALADTLLRGLREPERGWWARRRRWLVEGLFFADRQAAFFRAFLLGLRAVAPRAARREILSSTDPEARRAAFRAHVRRGWLERALAEVGGRVNLFFPEAEWRASEYPRTLSEAPLGYLEDLVAAGVSDNPLFAHLVRPRDEALPAALLAPHLRPGAFDGLRAARVRVRAMPDGPERTLSEVPEGLTGAYLSNIVDYLDAAARRRLFEALVPRLGLGAPVLIYSNEAYPKVPEGLGLRLDGATSAAAAARDRARIYRRIEVYRTAGERPAPARGATRLRVVR